MKLRILLALLVVCAVAAPAPGLGASRWFDFSGDGRFVVWYAKPRDADEKLLVSLIKASALDKVTALLSQALIIPKKVTIAVKGGDAGPYYNPDTHVIVLNHPFSALGLKVFKAEYPKISDYDLGVAFASLEYFVLFHEIGHALVDLWSIPVLGREEDAVDAFSTIFMTTYVPNGGQIALWGADFFDFLGRNKARYGSNPTKYRGLEQVIPHSRLVRCPSEYAQLKKSWLGFLKPHVRTHG